MRELERRTSLGGVKRIYYQDAEGQLIEKIIHDQQEHANLIAINRQHADNFRCNNGESLRPVMDIPNDIFLKELSKYGVKSYLDSDGLGVINSIMRNPEYRYLRRVPDNYNIKRIEV